MVVELKRLTDIDLSDFLLLTQGDLSGAILMYREAAAAWHGSTVVLFSLINALVESGRSLEVGFYPTGCYMRCTQIPLSHGRDKKLHFMGFFHLHSTSFLQ